MARQITSDCFPESAKISDVSVDLLPSNTTSNNNTDVMAKPELASHGARIDDDKGIDDKGIDDDKGMTDVHAASTDEAPASVAGDVVEAAMSKQSAAITSDAAASTGYVLSLSKFIELLHIHGCYCE